jgi:type II secretory pathway component PulJ
MDHTKISETKRINCAGFSLLEMTMVAAISTIIFLAFFSLLQFGNVQSQTTQTMMTLQENARRGLAAIAQEIRLSAPTRVTIFDATCVTAVVPATNPGSCLQAQVPDPANPVTGTFTANWGAAHTIRYSRNGADQVIRTDLTAVPQTNTVIANDVTGLTFTGSSANPNVVTLTMTSQRTMANGRAIPLTMTSQAEVRNS